MIEIHHWLLVVLKLLPENQKFEIANPMSTFVENLLVAQGVLDFTPITDMSGAPQEFWQVNLRGTPMYTLMNI